MIENLTKITFCLPDSQYAFSRSQIEKALGSKLYEITETKQWHAVVQGPLASDTFVQTFFEHNPS